MQHDNFLLDDYRHIFNKVLVVPVDEEAVSKVFWTSATKSGCAGQYTQCFVGNNKANLEYEHSILSSKIGGSCVAVTLSGEQLTAKTMPCTTKLFLACQSEKLRSAENRKIEEETSKVRMVQFSLLAFSDQEFKFFTFLYARKLCALIFFMKSYFVFVVLRKISVMVIV